MKLVAWDTSGKTGSVAALEDGRIVAEWTLNLDMAAHAERLLWSVDQILASAGWTLDDVTALAVGVGPGSFTGLRIGITTARTLAQVRKLPLVGVSSLAALARPAADSIARLGTGARVIAAAQACRGEVYALWGQAKAVARCTSLPCPGVKEEVLEEETLKTTLRGFKLGKGVPWTVVGPAAATHPEIWAVLPKASRVVPTDPLAHGVQGRYVALLAWERWEKGGEFSLENATPRYLRAPDAEKKLKAGLLPVRPVRVLG
jgi:tRNA threonylcarbamoyladenosine biosynthesis protein TsaB